MVSTLTRRNAEISFKALALGALDYVPKPDTNREILTSLDLRQEVIRKIKSLGRGRAPTTSEKPRTRSRRRSVKAAEGRQPSAKGRSHSCPLAS
jgi:two-component system chemotaxis response regulator CheB